ncbi:MAG: hypothetical protein NDP13_01490 [Crenarchaeota archaeon]|nr:hypothetical protein [Thermoproteota archaeon]
MSVDQQDKTLLSFKCPVCGEVVKFTVEEHKIKNDPSGVYTIPLLHNPPNYSPHLIVISIDPHGFVRSAYLYKQLYVIEKTGEEELTKLEKRIEEAKFDAHELALSKAYDVLKETYKIIQAFQMKYREDLFLEILGNTIIHHVIKSGKLRLNIPRDATLSEISKECVLKVLKIFRIDADLYYGLGDTVIIKHSEYPIEFIRGILNGLLVKIGDYIGQSLMLVTESLNPILFRIEPYLP